MGDLGVAFWDGSCEWALRGNLLAPSSGYIHDAGMGCDVPHFWGTNTVFSSTNTTAMHGAHYGTQHTTAADTIQLQNCPT